MNEFEQLIKKLPTSNVREEIDEAFLEPLYEMPANLSENQESTTFPECEAAAETEDNFVPFNQQENVGNIQSDAGATAVVAANTHTDEDTNYNNPQKRIRFEGNSNVVASHYNTLEEKGLVERSKSRIFYMRNFNNWIKSMLIHEYITNIRDASKLGAPLRVLDMCCGKGGDLYKWEKSHITHLICTDIAAVSIEQCETRYKALQERNSRNNGGGRHSQFPTKFFSAEFIACDCTRVRLREQYKDPSIELNLVSCQFAFHYCFESLKQAECMVKNAAECLKTGGFFIGTIPNANEIMRRQRETNSKTLGNGVYEISFLCDTECPPLFGGKYNFQLDGVVNCPEFLVHFPLLVKLARKYGLELVMTESFSSYFKRMIETSKGLIEKMQGLETYPPQYGNETNGEKEEYEHAVRFLATKDDRFKKCGTMSQTEWEAASLYTVFAFRKLKTQWNDKGQPEYV